MDKKSSRRFLTILDITLIVVLTLPIIIPLFTNEWFTNDENVFNIIRLNEFAHALTFHNLYPRWLPDLYGGYGYPFFDFYAPLPFFIGAFFTMFKIPIYIAIKMVMALSILGSGIGMYALCKMIFNRFGGIISALLYIYAPYHVLELYVRGNVGELVAMLLFPASIALLYKFIVTNKRNRFLYLITGSFSIALLITSHTISALTLPIIVGSIIYFLILLQKKITKQKINNLLYTTFAFIGGIGLSSIFWLPAILEKKLVQTEGLFQEHLLFNNNFVSPDQIFRFEWEIHISQFSIPNNIGIGLIFSIPVITSIALLVVSKNFSAWQRRICAIALAISVMILGMMMPQINTFPLLFLWEKIKILQYIQFPWRLSIIPVALLSIIAGSIGYWLTTKFQNGKFTIVQYIITIFTTCIVIFPGYKFFQNILFIRIDSIDNIFRNDSSKHYDSKTYTNTTIERNTILSLNASNGEWHTTQGDEYLPKTINTKPYGFSRKEFFYIKRGDENITLSQDSYETLDDLQYFISYPKTEGGTISFQTEFSQNTIIHLHHFYFPEWKAISDNKTHLAVEMNNEGYISVEIPKGKHAINVSPKNTQIRNVANIITLISFFIMLSTLIRYFRKRNVK